MKIGETLYSFRITRIRRLDEIDADLIEMEHEKSGASLAFLNRSDENKAFSIAFKTIPEDSTGVFHILEHSVLCGSDDYPVKEPFVELLKSSVQTFLNAMTYPDKTVYPVCSRNDKDFLNLIRIYLDAVFHPAIYHKPEIFRQEGWRYETDENGKTVYQGVVFNEMKGDSASPESVLETEMSRLLFPDNCYRFNYGGDPAVIPDLTYEKFLNQHRKYYHPSNSRICLCGSVDLDGVLPLIDSFLSQYDRKEADFSIPIQNQIPYVEEAVPYEIGKEESADEKTIVSLGLMLGRFDEKEKLAAAEILAGYLADENESPLKRAVLQGGLGQDLQVNLHGGIEQPWISVEVWNTDADKIGAIKETIKDVISGLCEKGLDHDKLLAYYSSFAFSVRSRGDGDGLRSLGEALAMLDTWLYDGDPAQSLLMENILSSLEQKLDSGYFEALLRELFLENKHRALLILTPSSTLGEEKRKREAGRLAAEMAKWTDEDRVKHKRESEDLAVWQQTPDSPEALATIPMLKLSDLRDKPADYSASVEFHAGIPVLKHRTDSQIRYLNYHFNVSDLTLEELPCLSLLSSVLGKFPTGKHSVEELQTLVKKTIGRLSFQAVPIPDDDPDKVKLIVSVKMACLAEQTEKAISLVSEILTETRFDDRRILREILKQDAMERQMSLTSSGTRYALMRASSGLTAKNAAREALDGFSYASFLKTESQRDDAGIDALLSKLSVLAARSFTFERMTLSLSENAGDEPITLAAAQLPKNGVCPPDRAKYSLVGSRREGIVVPAGVGFAAKAANLSRHGRAFHGSMLALSNVLSYHYLWNEIRVRGGAYGCGFYGRDDGDLVFYTFRDPQTDRSLGIFDAASDFIKRYCESAPDLTGAILSSVAELDPLLGTEKRILAAEWLFFRNSSHEEICKRYSELLAATPSDLLDLCDALDELKADNAVCVVGGQPQIDACGDLLSNVLTL